MLERREYRVVRYSTVPRPDGRWVDVTVTKHCGDNERKARAEAARSTRYLVEASVETRMVGPWTAEQVAPDAGPGGAS